jgi:hypothetical protein
MTGPVLRNTPAAILLAHVAFCRTIAGSFLPSSSIKIGGRLPGVRQVRLTVHDEKADEMAQRVYKTLLRPAPDDARAQLEELALRHDPAN